LLRMQYIGQFLDEAYRSYDLRTSHDVHDYVHVKMSMSYFDELNDRLAMIAEISHSSVGRS
jgi:hypothetical protein